MSYKGKKCNYSSNFISQVGPVVKSLPAKARFNPWVWKSPGRGHGNPFQYSGWENPMDRGAWWATVHIKMSQATNAREGVEKRGPAYTVGGNVNWCSFFGELSVL